MIKCTNCGCEIMTIKKFKKEYKGTIDRLKKRNNPDYYIEIICNDCKNKNKIDMEGNIYDNK